VHRRSQLLARKKQRKGSQQKGQPLMIFSFFWFFKILRQI
jgi:hypothetical protein